jgi:hypothetical protein
VTIQLRYLQTLAEVSGNQASTIVFPLPLDLLRPLIEAGQDRAARERGDPAPPNGAPDQPPLLHSGAS